MESAPMLIILLKVCQSFGRGASECIIRAFSYFLYSAQSSMNSVATPDRIAAFATASETTKIRRGSNGVGMM